MFNYVIAELTLISVSLSIGMSDNNTRECSNRDKRWPWQSVIWTKCKKMHPKKMYKKCVPMLFAIIPGINIILSHGTCWYQNKWKMKNLKASLHIILTKSCVNTKEWSAGTKRKSFISPAPKSFSNPIDQANYNLGLVGTIFFVTNKPLSNSREYFL